jgi:hypothetical protein
MPATVRPHQITAPPAFAASEQRDRERLCFIP